MCSVIVNVLLVSIPLGVLALGDAAAVESMMIPTNFLLPDESHGVVHWNEVKDDVELECALCEPLRAFQQTQRIDQSQHNEENGKKNLGEASCCTTNGTTVDCSNCGLTNIPKNLPSYITVLMLGNNKIDTTSLGSKPFAGYPRLTLLNLSWNKITQLPDDVFEGLGRLRCLCLQGNAIRMDESFNSSKAFLPLSESLVYLKINKNNENTSDTDLIYPDFALGILESLSHLYLDGLYRQRFMNGGYRFPKLTHLTLAGFEEGNCNIAELKEGMFELDTLMYLNIADCQIFGDNVSELAFENLKSLQTLDVSNNFNLGIEAVGNFMLSFNDNSSLKNLIMERIQPRFTPCVAVYKETLRHFRETKLEVIAAMNNQIEIIEYGALWNLPTTLRFLDLTGNQLIFGAYIKDLSALVGLSELVLNHKKQCDMYPNEYPSDVLNCGRGTLELNSISQKDHARVLKQDTIQYIPVPPRVSSFSMTNYGLAYNVGKTVKFLWPNELTSIDLRGNVFGRLDGPILGLNNLTSLHLDGCKIDTIGHSLFDNFPKLQYLYLSRNVIGDCINTDTQGDIFGNLTQLRMLNLSLNNIFHLSAPVFKDLVSLETLDLSQNRLSSTNFSISHMRVLRTLILKKNQIRTLDEDIRAHLSAQIRRGHEVSVDLSYNPITCDCENLPFLEWLLETGVLEHNITNQSLYCVFTAFSSQPMVHGYAPVMEELRRSCAKHDVLFIIVLIAALILAVIIARIVIFRFRWTLRYWYHTARIMFTAKTPAPADLTHDVFVSYSDLDTFVEEELVPTLRDEFNQNVLIHGNGFPAGAAIADSIHHAVSMSRKTLVVISRNMLRSHWCKYEMQMARREAITRGRAVLVFLFIEDICSWELDSDIVRYIKESTYITYPTEAIHQRAFWRRLATDLGADIPLQ